MQAMFGALAEGFDLPILDWIAEHLWCGFLDAVMPVITLLGDAGIFWILIAVVMQNRPCHGCSAFDGSFDLQCNHEAPVPADSTLRLSAAAFRQGGSSAD